MASIGGQFIVERRRCVAPIPSVGQLRYMLKVVPMEGERYGDAVYRFQNGVPRDLVTNATIVKGPIGRQGIDALWATGRWTVMAATATHLTLRRDQ
jgi:hypothetical protein